MKIKDLIEMLKEFDEDSTVRILAEDDWWHEICGVQVINNHIAIWTNIDKYNEEG